MNILTKCVVLLLLAMSMTAQETMETQPAITNLTMNGDGVGLAWEDCGQRPEITDLQVEARNSLLPGAPWVPVTNVAKTITNVTVPMDDSPARFFRLVANVVRKIIVAFDANGGTQPDPDTKEVTVGQPYGNLPGVERSGGFTFDGWFTARTEGAVVDAATVVTANEDHFLFAQWTPNAVEWIPGSFSTTVTNDVPNAFIINAATGTEVDFTYAADALPAGFGFAAATRQVTVAQGTEAGAHEFSITAEPSNGLAALTFAVTVVVAKKPVTVTFDAGGGTPSFATKNVFWNDPYGDLPAASQPGYTFGGWRTELNGGAEITSATTVASNVDHTLHAQWTPNPVEWLPSTFTATVTNDIANILPLHAASGNGVTFTYAAPELPVGFSFNPATLQLTVAAGTSAGTYGFTLLATPSNGLPSLTLGVSVHVAHKLTVTFNSGIGTASFASKDVIWSESYGTLPTATHATYTFAGWWTDATAGSQVQPATTVTTDANHTLYARWVTLTAAPSIVFDNANSSSTTIPLVTVSPAGAALTASSYTAYAYQGGVAGTTMPSGTGTSGATWAMTYTPSTRVISVPAGTTVGRYQFHATAYVTGTSPALTLTSPTFTVEVRETGTYWINALEPGAIQQWTNPQNMYKTSPSDYPFAYVDLPNLFYRERAMYPERTGIGLEQPTYVIPVATTVDIRSWRDRSLSSGTSKENNNLLHAYVQVFPGGARTTVMHNEATNPPGDKGKDSVFNTVSAAVNLIPRNGTGRIGFNAHNDNAGGTNFRVAWARFNVTWAPPATGITY